MTQQGLMARMGRWFRRTGTGAANDLPGVGRDGFLAGVESGQSADGAADATLPKLSRQQLREQALEKLQDGHLRVIELIDSLRRHMESQDRRGEGMAASLEQIAGNMADLSAAAVRQSDTLGGIATQVQAGNDRAQRRDEAFAEFPALAKAQRDALTTLSEHVAAGRRADERIGDSLDTVGGVLESFESSNATSTLVLRGLQEASAREQELIGELIQKQRKWLSRLVVVALCVSLAAITLGVIALSR